MDRGACWGYSSWGHKKIELWLGPYHNKQVFWGFFFPLARAQPVLKRGKRSWVWHFGTPDGPVIRLLKVRGLQCERSVPAAPWIGGGELSHVIFLSSTLYSPPVARGVHPSRCERGTWPGCRGAQPQGMAGWRGRGVGGGSAAVAPDICLHILFCSLWRWLLMTLCMVTGWLLQLCMCVLEIGCTAILKIWFESLKMGFKFLGLISVNLNTVVQWKRKNFLLNIVSDVGCSVVSVLCD